MIAQHLVILQVIIPLIAAPICLLLKRGEFCWLWTTIVTFCTFILSLWLLSSVLTNGTAVYEIGNWAPPWGIEYRVDLLSAYVILLVSVMASVVAPYMLKSVRHEIPKERQYLFYLMYQTLQDMW